MKKMKISRRFWRRLFLPGGGGKQGFTLIELLVGSLIMLIVLVATLSLYSRSNKITIDQQQYADLQNNVRAGMYFIARDTRSAGVGLGIGMLGYFIEGDDATSPAPEAADSIKLFGNFDQQLVLNIRDYNGGVAHGSENVFLYEGEVLNLPYPCPEFYEDRVVLIISTKCPGCFAYRFIPENQFQACLPGTDHIVFAPGKSDINPPGGLVDILCPDECWIDGIITIGQIKYYWLDTTGNMTSFREFTLTAGQDGYLGIPNVLYLTTNTEAGDAIHLALAMNIENLQFQYNGDLDDNGTLDGFRDWDNNNWTILASDTKEQKEAKAEIIARIKEIRTWVVGKTERPFVSVSGTPPAGTYLYQRPTIANSPGDGTVDRCRRFVLESTSNIRNLSLSLYNLGTR